MSKIYQLIKHNSKRVNINYGQGEEIWESIPKFILKTIKEGEIKNSDTYKSIFIKYFGTFYPNKRYIEKVNEMINKKRDEENNK